MGPPLLSGWRSRKGAVIGVLESITLQPLIHRVERVKNLAFAAPELPGHPLGGPAQLALHHVDGNLPGEQRIEMPMPGMRDLLDTQMRHEPLRRRKTGLPVLHEPPPPIPPIAGRKPDNIHDDTAALFRRCAIVEGRR